MLPDKSIFVVKNWWKIPKLKIVTPHFWWFSNQWTSKMFNKKNRKKEKIQLFLMLNFSGNPRSKTIYLKQLYNEMLILLVRALPWIKKMKPRMQHAARFHHPCRRSWDSRLGLGTYPLFQIEHWSWRSDPFNGWSDDSTMTWCFTLLQTTRCLKITGKVSILRAKRAMFTFWVNKSSLKVPKMANFREFLKISSLWSNSVTSWQKIVGK